MVLQLIKIKKKLSSCPCYDTDIALRYHRTRVERKIFQLKDPSPIKDVHYFCHVIHYKTEIQKYTHVRGLSIPGINVEEIINYDVESLIMIEVMESNNNK